MVALQWLWSRKWYVLIVAVALVAIIALAVKLATSRSHESDLMDQLTSAEVVRQIGETQAEVLTAQVADLNVLLERRNADLADQLARGEKVVTLVQTRIVYRQGKPATADVPGTVTQIPATGDTPASVRVDFKADRGMVHVAGYTLAPAGTAHLEWTLDPIRLDVVVSRTKDGRYRTLFDTHDPDLRIEAASTAIDPSAIDVQRRWYVAASAMVGIPEYRDVAVGVDGGYLFDRWSLGLAYLHDGYGLVTGHHLGLRVGGRF